MLDTNVLQALMQPDHAFHDKTLEAVVTAQTSSTTILLCPVAHAEMHSLPSFDVSLFSAFIEDAGFEIDWEIPRAAWTLAGEEQARYQQRRRSSGAPEPRRLMADFLIGAHALSRDAVLHRFDTGYKTIFPTLELRLE
jgi:predicted nucleic acid-binding protein